MRQNILLHGDRIISHDTSVSISCDGGTLTVWSASPTCDTEGEHTLKLAPGRIAIIGRQQGGRLDYLDPTLVPTQLVPDSGQSVLTMNSKKDICVSRGHFTLKGSTLGILLVNGVPGKNGDIR